MKNTCDAKTRNGKKCSHPAGWGTFHKGIGACHFHHRISLHESEKLEGKSFKPKSIYEECALLELKADQKVDKYFYEPLLIPYNSPFERGPKILNYKPDIIVRYTDTKRVIIEVKSILENWNSETLAKFKAADDYAKCNGYNFKVWVYDRRDNSKSICSFRDIVDKYYF